MYQRKSAGSVTTEWPSQFSAITVLPTWPGPTTATVRYSRPVRQRDGQTV
jgi:hypothetical protein